MRGSAGSIMDDIAEGLDRGSRLEFINLLGIAKGQSGELKSQLHRCLEATYIAKETFEEFYNETDEIARMIAGFIDYLDTPLLKGKN